MSRPNHEGSERSERPEASDRVEALVELQDQIDRAQEVSPLSGAKRLVVGGWLALAAHYFMIGGVPLDGLQPGILGLAAVGGWGCAIWGGTKFVLARRKLRALKKEIPEALPEGPVGVGALVGEVEPAVEDGGEGS